MQIRPLLQEAQAYTTDYKVIPVSCELYADCLTPLEALRKLRNVSRHCFILESVEDRKQWGRYTFLGYDPQLEVTCTDGKMTLSGRSHLTLPVQHPKTVLRQILADNKSPRLDYLPSFTGGLVGYFAYDYFKYAEPTLRLDARDTENFKDVDLMLFDKVIAFDNYRQKIVLIINIKLADLETEYNRALLELATMKKLLLEGTPARDAGGRMTTPPRELFSREEYCAMVQKAQAHIYNGDIFQVVLSNRLTAGFSGSLFNLYRVLRTINPSPYMFYFASDDLELAGASPETLVKLADGVLHTFPLAGTRPRGKDDAEDHRLEQELLTDPKEAAEHNMLVDLGRNDIGKVSEFGSVAVEKYMAVEKFSHVMHLGSTVRGQLRQDCDALEALDAILPAGTLSGAPKIRACQIINELENNKRGIYGGAVGYLDFAGNMDTCIGIRLAFKKNGQVFVRAGAGIVADSVPEKEYQECLNKARAVVEALRIAQEGLDG